MLNDFISLNILFICSQKVMEKMLVHLNLCEHAMKKSQAVSLMNAEEMLIYDSMSSEIDYNIKNTKTEIEHAKEELKKAKTIRRNRMEYDVLAKLIIQHPPRTETTKRLDDLKDELQALKVNLFENSIIYTVLNLYILIYLYVTVILDDKK